MKSPWIWVIVLVFGNCLTVLWEYSLKRMMRDKQEMLAALRHQPEHSKGLEVLVGTIRFPPQAIQEISGLPKLEAWGLFKESILEPSRRAGSPPNRRHLRSRLKGEGILTTEGDDRPVSVDILHEKNLGRGPDKHAPLFSGERSLRSANILYKDRRLTAISHRVRGIKQGAEVTVIGRQTQGPDGAKFVGKIFAKKPPSTLRWLEDAERVTTRMRWGGYGFLGFLVLITLIPSRPDKKDKAKRDLTGSADPQDEDAQPHMLPRSKAVFNLIMVLFFAGVLLLLSGFVVLEESLGADLLNHFIFTWLTSISALAVFGIWVPEWRARSRRDKPSG